MKNLAFALISISSINCQQLSSKCESGNLVIEIPSSNQNLAQLLHLEAGSCDQNNYGGSIDNIANTSTTKITVPIDACNLRVPLNGASANFGLYRATANITLGAVMNGVEIVFKNTVISAECGVQTSYSVTFNYDDIESTTEECEEIIDGACVYPSHEEDISFSITEYTDNNFDVVVNEETRAKLAGENIFLSVRASYPDSLVPQNYKFAVTECSIRDSKGNRYLFINPGAESEDASCDLNAIGLVAGYNGEYFNFQHALFLFSTVEKTSSYVLGCSVEVCDKTDAGSQCNKAALPCMKTDTDSEATWRVF